MRRFDLFVLLTVGIIGVFSIANSYRFEALKGRMEMITNRLEQLVAGRWMPGTAPNSYLQQVESQLSSLETRLSSLEDAKLALLEGIAMAPNAATDLSLARTSETQAGEDLEHTISEQRQLLQQHHNRGKPDRARTDEVENAFYKQLVDHPLLGVLHVEQIDCRDTGCRVAWRYESDLTSEERFILENDFIAALAATGLKSGTQFANENGTSETYFPPSNSNSTESAAPSIK